MSNVPRKPTSWVLKIGALVVAITGAYFANVSLQSHWGRQALRETGLTVHSFSEAKAIAATANKPILAYHAAIWCPSCRRFDTQVLTDPQVRAAIAEDYIFARIEYESEAGAAFRETYAVSGFPLLLILNPDGSVRSRLATSPPGPEAFLAQIQPVPPEPAS